MQKKLKKFLIAAFNVMIFFVFSLLHYSNILSFKIFGAGTILLIPLLVAFSLWHSPIACAIAGMLSGIILDSSAQGSYCFNAIILLLIGVFVSVTSNTLFNKNLPSAIVISFICSVIYYLMQWVIFHTFSEGVHYSLTFLLEISLPSAILTALFIFPFYYLYKYIVRIRP
ncbi:MAG: hypothetical protein II342_03270 [Clostridia bacterium]|jgi:uncharacterized membrane protein YeaQ/YmgE (transglycosylase-associated protein family)|nr:hypothetical protein [Clostridia bacterium]